MQHYRSKAVTSKPVFPTDAGAPSLLHLLGSTSSAVVASATLSQNLSTPRSAPVAVSVCAPQGVYPLAPIVVQKSSDIELHTKIKL